ncbi:MAG: hypothetical protein ACP5OA_03630 [Candidatus Woesearchaeota archaeon]
MNGSVYENMQKSEKEVSEYLQRLKLWWQYEQPVYVLDEKERPRVWTPDFYLPELGIYIEVCGSEKFDYQYRSDIYFRNKLPIIFVHRYKNPKEWQEHIIKKIIEIQGIRMKKIKDLGKR